MKMPPGVPGRVMAMSISACGAVVRSRAGGRCSTSVMGRCSLGAGFAADNSTALFGLQPRRLEDRPPLVDLSLPQRAERLGRALVGVRHIEAEVDHALLEFLVSHGRRDGGID